MVARVSQRLLSTRFHPLLDVTAYASAPRRYYPRPLIRIIFRIRTVAPSESFLARSRTKFGYGIMELARTMIYSTSLIPWKMLLVEPKRRV